MDRHPNEERGQEREDVRLNEGDEDFEKENLSIEIQAGIEMTREQDRAKAEALEAWLDQVVATYRVLAMDAPVFRESARLRHRISDTLIEDAMIAATAVVHNLSVATRNVRDFAAFNVPVLNPFKSR